LFEEKKELLRTLVDKMNEAHPGCAHLELRDQYYNMREVVEPQKHIVDLAFEAMTSRWGRTDRETDPGRYGWGTVVVYGVTYSESFYGRT